MTGQIVAILRRDATAAGLTQPNIHRDVDNPGVLLVHTHPATLRQWQQWLDLLGCPTGAESSRGGNAVYAHGRYRGCKIRLVGNGVPRLRYELRRAADPDLPPFGSPITPS